MIKLSEFSPMETEALRKAKLNTKPMIHTCTLNKDAKNLHDHRVRCSCFSQACHDMGIRDYYENIDDASRNWLPLSLDFPCHHYRIYLPIMFVI